MNKCLYCFDDSYNYELCRECYYLAEEGSIDQCSCGNYKDSYYDLCKSCYQDQKNNSKNKLQNNRKINDNMIKGRIAETIIEELFKQMNYEVYRFGMENTIPGFGSRSLPKKGDIASFIRKMPDLVVVKDGKTFFIEVKYRSNGTFDFNNYFKGNYPYPSAYIILVTPKHIKVQKASELEKGTDFVYLGSHPDFVTEKEIILAYIDFTKKFYNSV